MAQPIIMLRNAEIWFDQNHVLKKINLSIFSQEHVAILGPNGAGKSTLLKLMTADLHPRFQEQPSLVLDGKPCWDLFEWRKKIGFVSNELQSMYDRECDGLTVILSGFVGSIGLWNKPTDEQIAIARRIAEQLEIMHLLKHSICHMSSGEARRFLIARALVHDPKIIIFDEPTNSLDVKARRMVLGTMRKLAQKGYTLVIVTHAVEEIIPEINRVILLKQGEIFRDGPKEQVLTAQSLGLLFDLTLTINQHNGFYRVT